jgi:hypothetical protein
MSQSTLRQVLTIFETAEEPLSLPQIARELDVSAARLEEMIQFWVRKGKIRMSGSMTDCGTCGKNGACPFVLAMPRTYELVREEDDLSTQLVLTSCRHMS